MTKNRVSYTLEADPTKFLIMVEKGWLVAQFLDAVRDKKKMDDLCKVWKDGISLPLEDEFDRWWEEGKIFRVTSQDVIPEPLEPAPPPATGTLTGTRTTTVGGGTGTVVRLNPVKFPYDVFTNVSEDSFKRGDKIDIEHDCTVDQVKEKVEALLRNMRGVDIPEPHELHVFLPGGLPFLHGTVQDWYDATDVNRHNLYVVVTRPLGDAVDRVITNVADCSSDFMKSLLSPLYDSTPQGYFEMACLLGYFQYDGHHTQDILLRLARVTRFAPLVCSLYRFLEHEEVNGRNIIAITAILHTLFKSIPRDNIANRNVLERSLKLMSVILLVGVEGNQYLNLYASDWDANTKDVDYLEAYCRDHGQQRHFVIWQNDTVDPSVVGLDIVKLALDEIDDVFSTVSSLKPLSPATARYVHGTAILKGAANSILMLGHVHGDRNQVVIIDPANGRRTDKNIETMCADLGDRTVDDICGLDAGWTSQVIEVLFDESISMVKLLDGHTHRGHPENSRIEYAKQFLRALMARTYAYRVSSVFGLITFNKTIVDRCVLSPLVSDFTEAIAGLKPAAGTVLWDAIDSACKTIRDYNVRTDGDEEMIVHPNAVQRILVISDGRDEGSVHNPWEVAATCIRNRVVVDSVLVATDDDNIDLCLLCQLTGGMAFRTESLEAGLALFEQEAFLNIDVRRTPGACSPDDLTKAFWDRRMRTLDAEHAYSGAPANKVRYECETGFAIHSPAMIAYLAQERNPPTTQRATRIVSELKYILNRPDPNVQVWVNAFAWEKWRVFVKGPDRTPYAGKWWSLYVTFPPNYPSCPPIFRFVSVPYHPNVSADGKVIFGAVDEDYRCDKRVHTMIMDVIRLLEHPELEQAIQPRIAEQYRRDRGAFENQARIGANAQAKNEIDEYDYMQGIQRADPPRKGARYDDRPPSQLTATITKPGVNVLPTGNDAMVDDGDVKD